MDCKSKLCTKCNAINESSHPNHQLCSIEEAKEHILRSYLKLYNNLHKSKELSMQTRNTLNIQLKDYEQYYHKAYESVNSTFQSIVNLMKDIYKNIKIELKKQYLSVYNSVQNKKDHLYK